MRRALMILAAAACVAPDVRALDLLQAWQGARQHAPDAAEAQAAREAGVARAEQARALWRPNVSIEGAASYASSESATRGARFSAPGFGQTDGVAFDNSVSGGAATRYGLVVRQPVYSRERSARSEALEIAAQAAELEWTQARQALILRTADAYFDAALAAARLRLLERQQQAVDRAATEARDRFKIGDRPVTDVHEATARAAALQAERLAAETQRQLSRGALADLTGLPPDGTPLPLPDDVSIGELGALDDWLARAQRQNPGVRLAEANLEAAESDARGSGAAFSPTVDVVAQLAAEHLSGSGDFGRASNTSRNNAVGLQLSVPLYTGGLRSARHAEARALVDKSRAQLEGVTRLVAQQTRAAWSDLAVGRARIDALAAALQASHARFEATHEGLMVGDRTTLDLLNAENDAAAAELALLEARVRLITRRLQLAALAGELDDATLQLANAQLRDVHP